MATAFRGFRFLQRTVFGGVLLASSVASIDVYGQGPYYPENPPGMPPGGYGTTYTGITSDNNPNLIALQNLLQSLYNVNTLPPGSLLPTLQVPIPTGDRAPTAAEYQTLVQTIIQGGIQSPGNFPS